MIGCDSACCSLFDEEAPLQRAGRGVALQRVGELLVEICRRRASSAATHRRTAGSPSNSARDSSISSGTVGAVAQQRIRAQRMIRPLALQARDQRALDRGVRLGIERVHQRRADERVGVRQAVQLEPRGIGVDHDAFLHVRDGVGRAGHERLQLIAILARGADRAVERARLAMRFELARDDGLQAHRMLQRHRRRARPAAWLRR